MKNETLLEMEVVQFGKLDFRSLERLRKSWRNCTTTLEMGRLYESDENLD